MDELTIGDKKYISTKRAAELTGYAKDYVGQLCREGHVEAKMVGRSWYVLESSIRTHRFGIEEKGKEVITDAPAETAPIKEERRDMQATWEKPRYVTEVPTLIPSLIHPTPTTPVSSPADLHETAQSLEMSDTQKSIVDMQEAWKEWFETRKIEEPLLETPAVIDAREEHIKEEAVEEVPVAVHKIPVAPPEPVERHMDIVTVRTPEPIVTERAVVTERPVYKRRRRSTGSVNLITAAFMVAIAFMVAAVAFVGTGLAEQYIGTNPIIDFLGGSSSINK